MYVASYRGVLRLANLAPQRGKRLRTGRSCHASFLGCERYLSMPKNVTAHNHGVVVAYRILEQMHTKKHAHVGNIETNLQ